MADVVLFGATGYTGRLTAHALVERGVAPVLAGRRRDALEALARELGGLPVRVADVADAASVRALVGRGDVLLSTVGPFARHGRAALEAALQAKAHYLDSTGEPAFLRLVFEQFDAPARKAGVGVVPAFGYDYVPGHTAAAAALERAGPEAVRVEIGYFAVGGRFGMSQGTLASLAGALVEPGVFFDGGRRRLGYAGLRSRRFDVDGRSMSAVSVPGSECLALPASYPRLRDVDVYLGWFDALSPAMCALARAQVALFAVPGYRRTLAWATARLGSSGRGPDEAARAGNGSHVVAIAGDAKGRPLATAVLRGVNGYTYTARMLAWGAERALRGGLKARGALGPVAAYGLPALVDGNREAGLALTVS
jgi:short subunit dehydrogenase-like uncharacterized protein